MDDKGRDDGVVRLWGGVREEGWRGRNIIEMFLCVGRGSVTLITLDTGILPGLLPPPQHRISFHLLPFYNYCTAQKFTP